VGTKYIDKREGEITRLERKEGGKSFIGDGILTSPPAYTFSLPCDHDFTLSRLKRTAFPLRARGGPLSPSRKGGSYLFLRKAPLIPQAYAHKVIPIVSK
jgi:hypothetical protein